MLDTLVASRGAHPGPRAFWSGVLVVVLHSGAIAALVSVTAREATPRVVVIAVQPVPPPPARATPSRIRVPVQAPEVPVFRIPDGIAPPDVQIPPLSVAFGTERPSLPELVPDGDGNATQPLAPWLADELPEFLSAPQPTYPGHLRRLGVQGRVIVRAVVDTLGRVVPASVTVVASPHIDFIHPVREALKRALFRPGRLHGGAVTVLVEIPFDFRLTR